MGAMIIKELKLMIREKGNFFFLILMPLIFIVVFGSIFNQASSQTLTVSVHDADQTAASKALIKQIDDIKGFKVKLENSTGIKGQLKQIKAGKLSSLVVIDHGFAANLQKGSANLHFYSDAAESSSTAPIQAVLENIVSSYQQQKLARVLQAHGETGMQIKQTLAPPIHIQSVQKNSKHDNFMSQIVPGYTVMFVFFIMNSMVRRFFQEKESGMIARLQSTPLSSLKYLIGMWVPAFLSVIIQCAVLLATGYFFYNLHLGSPLAVTLIVLCLALCGTGLGLCLALVVRSENQGLGITQLLTLGGAIVAGLWFPSDMLPSFAQNIGYFTPQYWAMTSLQDVMIRGYGVSGIWLSLLVLVLIGITGLVIALLRFKPFLRAAAH
ncbi:MAG: ABC transporter permease [Sporolactobacillus sp.]